MEFSYSQTENFEMEKLSSDTGYFKKPVLFYISYTYTKPSKHLNDLRNNLLFLCKSMFAVNKIAHNTQ